MLQKVKQINYSPASGKVQYESDQMMFQEGDKNTAVIQLRGELDSKITVTMRIKPPEGDIIEVQAKTVPYKSIAREFQVPTDKVGIHQCQIIMSYTYETNVSEVFEYTVQESLK